MEMQFKNEIKKLADIVVWADNWITELKDGLTEEEFEEDAEVKEFEAVKKVVLESMERHAVYTNALNNDIVAKDAKIELMQKELDGRKAGYVALKARMDNVKKELEDTKEALDKTIESWVPLDAHDKVVDDLKDAIKERDNKIVELEKELAGRKKAFNDLNEEMATRYIAIETHNDICKTYENRVSELEKESEKWQDLAKMNRDTICNQYDVCEEFKKKIAELEEKVKHQKENLDGINKTLEIRNKEIDTLVKTLQTTRKEIEAHEAENARLSERIIELKKQVEYLKKELEECKEENSYLKKESKDKNDIIRKAYVRYVDEACKGREEIINECYEKLTKDDTGYTGFKQYTLRALEAQEGDEKKTKEFLCDSAEIIFYNKRAEEKRKEETKKELNEAFGIPCGEDAIE